MGSQAASPNVFNYLNYRHYLKDYLQFLRQKNPAFRFQTLVEKYGLKSRSHYIDILKGRKLTDAFLGNYVAICDLEGDAAKYFRAIVGYDQAGNGREKTGFFNGILSLSPNLETVKLEQEAYRYFSKWYHPVMLSLLDVYKGENDHRKLAKLFKPRISALQAKQAIKLLAELKFVSWDETVAQWRFHHKFFKCTDKARVVALKEFHRLMLEAGKQAYENDFDTQHFSTLTLSVSRKVKEELEGMIVNLRKSVMEKVKADAVPEFVVQVNMQLFELSKKARRGKKTGKVTA